MAYIYGTEYSEQLYGDYFYYPENDVIYGYGGNDEIWGLGGDDWLYGGYGSDVLYGGDGNDRLYGGHDNDWLYGGFGLDWLYGGVGNDRLYGGHGDDVLQGQSGNDQLYGQAGHDDLYGGAGRDTLSGGSGNDWLHGGTSRDVLTGGTGADTFYFVRGSSGITTSSADVITDWNGAYDWIDMPIAGTLTNYGEASTNALSIAEAAYLAQSVYTDPSVLHVFLFNPDTNTGYLVSDLNVDGWFETGVILKNAGYAAALDYYDIV